LTHVSIEELTTVPSNHQTI